MSIEQSLERIAAALEKKLYAELHVQSCDASETTTSPIEALPHVYGSSATKAPPPRGGSLDVTCSEPAPAPAPAKVKRKRRTKAQIEADKLAAETSPDPVVPDSDDPASLLDMPEEPLSQEPTYTLDDVHAVARSFGADHGLQAAKAIFARFNAINLATLAPEHFGACIAALKEAM